MSPIQYVITFALLVIATMITRFSPFILFKDGKTPDLIIYLGKVLPASIFALLIVYCLKGVNFFTGNHGLPELISLLLVLIIHLWKRNTLLSIALGTVAYMLLIQVVF